MITALQDTGLPGWVLMLIGAVCAILVRKILNFNGGADRLAAAAQRAAPSAADHGAVQHSMGTLPGLKAFTAVVLGGTGAAGADRDVRALCARSGHWSSRRPCIGSVKPLGGE